MNREFMHLSSNCQECKSRHIVEIQLTEHDFSDSALLCANSDMRKSYQQIFSHRCNYRVAI